MFTCPTNGCTKLFQNIHDIPKSKGQGLLQGRLKIYKMVHVLPNEEKKGMIMRKCNVLSK